ncbi:BTAD domain-containing putative transcriptional regulator [Yoonia sp.]|uniref:AfsR/SARP family transcriptional regulator n=1 Tax=Yoonia sp. TaxID=2212373 RepID=UPI003590137F
MSHLSILAFGQPRAFLSDDCPLQFPTEKSFELLLMIALAPGRSVGRSSGAAALRGEHPETQARKALSTDLWRLRKVFDDANLPSTQVFTTSGRSIAFHDDLHVFLDARFLEDVWDDVSGVQPDALSPDQADRIREAIQLYTGDFAQNLDQEWCFLYREKLRSIHLTLIGLLLGYEVAADNWASAVQWAERLLECDPLLEHAHRTLMQCHFLMGNRAVAIRQYSNCRDILERELGIAPSAETTRMYRGLVNVTVDDPVPSRAARLQQTLTLDPPPTSGQGKFPKGSQRPMTDQLSMALGSLDAARSLVANVDQRLRRMPPEGETS